MTMLAIGISALQVTRVAGKMRNWATTKSQGRLSSETVKSSAKTMKERSCWTSRAPKLKQPNPWWKWSTI